MMIDQRNAGASVTNTGANAYTVDRWQLSGDQASKFSVQQNAGSVTPPVGFVNYLGCTSLSSYSVPTTEAYIIRQSIEGLNVSDLAWGTINAKAVTLSFQVYSSLTGAFGGVIKNSGNNRSYPFTYTISSPSTWTTVSVTIPGDTTGTWLTTNGIGMYVVFSLGSGSTVSGTAGAWAAGSYFSVTGATSVVGTNGATFYITGVQLEKGSTATSFDYRPYGTELALCQRYYEVFTATDNGASFLSSTLTGNTVNSWLNIYFKVTKRAKATVGLASGVSWVNGINNTASSIDGMTFGGANYFYINTTGGTALYASAEL